MLIVGTNKSPILKHVPQTFLLIDDGSIIDRLTFPKRRKITRFDPAKHSFNPLATIDHKRARDFLGVLNAVFPQGENTLTRGNADTFLLEALTGHPTRLDRLICEPTDLKDTGHVEAYRKIRTLLLSPVLNRVLCRPTNLSFKGILLARLNRAELGDFDCFVLGNLLIGQYQGHIIVPDFGFYAAPHHTSLIRQGRLTAGVNFLDEVPLRLRQSLLLMPDKIASHATFDDAETLAVYCGLARGTNEFNDYVAHAMA
jgi:hypothetical protein